MSDAQSILLILLFFYGIECLKWAPLDAVSLTSLIFSKSRWRMQMPTVHFFGAKKSMFVAPILPGIQLQLVTDQTGDGGHQNSLVKTASGVRRRLFRLKVRTLMLRTISAYVFATYFLFLPAFYVKFGLGSYVYTTVGIGYTLQAICAICYFIVHRRFFPRARGVRWLHTFYNLLLPWHAMRATDELFIRSSMDWSELAILGATQLPDQAEDRLALYWRQAQLLREPVYTAQTLAPILEEVGMSPDSAMRRVSPADAGQTFCPCCGAIYRKDIQQCIDCHGLDLRRS